MTLEEAIDTLQRARARGNWEHGSQELDVLQAIAFALRDLIISVNEEWDSEPTKGTGVERNPSVGGTPPPGFRLVRLSPTNPAGEQNERDLYHQSH